MKILFLTTFDVTWNNEHVFTREVSLALNDNLKGNELVVATMVASKRDKSVTATICAKGLDYRLIDIVGKNRREQIESVTNFISENGIDIVHSNMIEGIDIEACRNLNIPIVNTIHIGGFVCPRGGGFLKYDDSICSQPVGSQCARCMAKDMPFPTLTYALHRLTPDRLKMATAKRLDRFVLYLSAFLRMTTEPKAKQEFAKLANYSHVIAADERLIELLKMNGITERVHLLPHGVKERCRLPMPSIAENTPIKFYFLARAEYSKGLHILVEALKGIPLDKYELHVIGDTAYLGKKSEKYFQRIKKQCESLNVVFDGRVPNDKLEDVIKDYHVMVHSAIFLEIYGIAIAESLSMGRPVLATRCGGAEMQIQDGVNGWLIPPNDADALREAILHIISHREEIVEYGNNAKLPMPLDVYTSKLLEIYTQAIEEI